MNWKFDIDQRTLVQASDDLFVRSARLAYPDRYPMRIQCFRGSEPYVFTGYLRATVKPLNQPTGPALAAMVTTVSNSSVAEGILNLATVPVASFVKDYGDRPAILELAVFSGQDTQVASWSVHVELSKRFTADVASPSSSAVTQEDILAILQSIGIDAD